MLVLVPRYSTTPAPDATYVELGPGLAVLSPIRLDVEDHDGYDLELDVVALPAEGDRAGRFTASRICVKQRPGGPEVTGDKLRQLRIAMLVRGVGARWWETVTRAQAGTEISLADERLSDDMVARIRAAGPSDPEALTWVARAYRVALILGDPPTQAVQKALGLPRSTAGTWIKAARDQGFLGRSEGQGRAGG